MDKLISLVKYIIKNLDEFCKIADLRNIKVRINELKDYNQTFEELEKFRYFYNSGKTEYKNKIKEHQQILNNYPILDILNSFPNLISSVNLEDIEIKNITIKKPKHNSLIDNICIQNNTNVRFLEWNQVGLEITNKIIKCMRLNALKSGFVEKTTNIICSLEQLYNTGLYPSFKDQLYTLQDNQFLIPTAEVMLLHQKKIGRFFSFQKAFRKEGGSYGIRDKFIRLNEFSKLELFSISEPENSNQELDYILNCPINLLILFDISFRVLHNSVINTSFQSCKTYDIEAWSCTKKSYIELSSCSNTSDFQSRRLFLKKNNQFLHCLNGTALSLERFIFILLEYYTIPELIEKTEEVIKKLKK